MLTETPLPWLPSCGLTTTGRPTSWAMAQASSKLLAGRPHGHGHARGMQEALGQVFVLCDRFGNGAGGVGFCGLNAPLFRAPAKLNQAAIGQAAYRNAACHGRVHNRAGGRPQANVFVEFVQLRNGPLPGRSRRQPWRLGTVARPDSAPDGPRLPRCIAPPPGTRQALRWGVVRLNETGQPACAWRLRVTFSRRVGQRGRLAWALTVKGPDFGEDATQLLLYRVLRRQAAVFGAAADNGFNGGVAAPEIGGHAKRECGRLA